MPKKKRATYDDKRRNVILKLSFIAITIALIILINIFISFSRSPSPSGINNEGETQLDQADVLGEFSERFESAKGEAKNYAETVTKDLEGASEKIIEKGKHEAESQLSGAVSETVYNSTLKPLIESFDKLPENQKTVIKDAVCK